MKGKTKLMLLYIAAAAGAAVMSYFFSLGMDRLKTAETNYNSIKTQMQAQVVKASTLVNVKKELADTKEQWDNAKQPYIINAEGGSFYDELGTLAEKYKINDISITPQPAQNGFYNGYLKAVPYGLEIKGPFPSVFNLLAGIEKLKTPAEIKPISIQQESGGTVSVKATVFLYSLNPPEVKEYVNGESGRYDPFFNSDIQEVLQEQKQTSVSSDTQQNSAQTANTTQSGSTQTNSTQQNSSEANSTQQNSSEANSTQLNSAINSTQPSNIQTNSTQQNSTQAGVQTVPSYKNPAAN